MANTYTTNYKFPKPAYNDGGWNNTINSVFDDIDTVIFQVNSNLTSSVPLQGDVTGTSATSTVSSIHATSGTIDGVVIGANKRANGSFSSLFASSGTLDGIGIGGNTPFPGTFTTLTVKGVSNFTGVVTFANYLTAPAVITTSYTPTSSSDSTQNTTTGSIWSDDSYLYHRNTDGSIVRIAWTTFAAASTSGG